MTRRDTLMLGVNAAISTMLNPSNDICFMRAVDILPAEYLVGLIAILL